jgi:hypothetical protein
MKLHLCSLVTLPIHPWVRLLPLVRSALMVCLLASATNVQAQQQGWSATGSLAASRAFGHSATLLTNGKVLVVGGANLLDHFCCPRLDSAELYDPAIGQWSATGSLSTPRAGHVAVRLDNGKVLVAGGSTGSTWDDLVSTAEIYDPDSGTWSATGGLSVGRAIFTATPLASGKILVTGGTVVADISAELYDPATGEWSLTGTMNSRRSLHTATLLPDGRVLVAGGINTSSSFLRSAELYDPATGKWMVTGDMITGRAGFVATLLHNGKVLVAAGVRDEPYDHYGYGIDKAELYDPATGQWSPTGSLAQSRALNSMTLLLNGTVLAVGGYDVTVNNVELYDPATGRWGGVQNLNMARSDHTATLLANGKVLVAGGASRSPNSAELYDTGLEIPLLTLNSTSYCIGDPWSLMVSRSARGASVRLMGVSNGSSWEIARWGATDQEGSFSAGGTIALGTEGTHTLSVEISGIRSTAVSFAVSQCKP